MPEDKKLANDAEFSLDDIDFDMLEQIASGIDNPAENLSLEDFARLSNALKT